MNRHDPFKKKKETAQYAERLLTPPSFCTMKNNKKNYGDVKSVETSGGQLKFVITRKQSQRKLNKATKIINR